MKLLKRLVFLFVIISAFQSMQCSKIDSSKKLNECCSFGKSRAASKSCTYFQFPFKNIPANLHNLCQQKIIECCRKQRDINDCNAGNDAAYSSKSCYNANRKFMACCTQCKIGIEFAKLGRECEVTAVNVDPLEAMSRTKCCKDQILSSDEEKSIGEENSSYQDESNEEDSIFLASSYNNGNKKEPCDDNHYCDHNCIIEGGHQKCTCNQGFELQYDRKTCKLKSPHEIRQKVFKKCEKGFFLNDLGNCEDINECEIEHNGCGENSICRNRHGYYECLPKDICSKGFRFNIEMKLCEDINECREFSNDCKPDQHCNNTIGSFFCSNKCIQYECRNSPEEATTFPTTRSITRRNWIPFRPKTTIAPDLIIKTEGCPKGFERNHRGACVDIDECLNNPCPSHLKCINRNGGYTCQRSSCPDGYKLNGTTCVFINNCDSNPCPIGYDCIHFPNSFKHTCRVRNCQPGYRRNFNGECVDIDECERRDMCQHGTCINAPGTYECYCNNGFKKDQKGHCIDIDECENSRCEQKCYNTFGSFKCACNHGYRISTRDNRTCEDIDECLEHGENSCIGKCANVEGSYECLCPNGFKRDGIYCADIDECAEYPNICGNEDDFCLNIAGSYKCMEFDCPDDYKIVQNRGHKYCLLNKLCGYENDEKECEKPWFYKQIFISKLANCTAPQLLFSMSIHSSKYLEAEIEDVKVLSIEQNVKEAEFDDFGIEKSASSFELVQHNRLDGPQEVEISIFSKNTDNDKIINSQRIKVVIVVSEYPFNRYYDKNIKYQSKYCPYGCNN